MVLDERITDALNRWETIASAEAIPERLVLLDLMRSSHAPADFSGVDLLVIQHHLGTTVPLVRALSEAGIAPDRIWHVDIPYSTNVKVRTALLELSGQDRCPPLFTDPLVDYSAAQLLRVTTTLLDMWRRDDPKPLLVLDDGAYFFRALSTEEVSPIRQSKTFSTRSSSSRQPVDIASSLPANMTSWTLAYEW
jgi:hypothetical protein